MNSVNMIGHLGKDPELKHLQNGDALASFSLAFDQGKDKDAGWVDVTVFGAQAENCAQYLSKGARVGVTGRLSYRTWEKDGRTERKLEVIASWVDFPPKSEAPARAEARPQADAPMDDPFGDQ